MKTFQKIALVSAIAAAPFAAQAELTPMSEGLMAETTGQAGVTIEINLGETGISVGEIEYTDEGSVLVRDVSVSGWDQSLNGGLGGASSVDIIQTIDVVENGSVHMVNSTSAGQQLRLQVGGIELVDNTTGNTNANSELLNSLDLKLELGATSTTKIHNVDIANTAAGTTSDGNGGFYAIQELGNFGVVGQYATNTSGLVIEADAGVKIVDMDLSLFGYSDAQGTLIANGAAATAGYTADDTTDAAGTDLEAFDAAANGGDGDGKIDAAEIANYSTYVANNAAVNIQDLTFDDGAGGVVNVEQTIWADSSGVYIQVGALAGNLSIGAIEIGGESIGAVAMRNINLSGMTQKIYGHN